jgi:hypothetical protein
LANGSTSGMVSGLIGAVAFAAMVIGINVTIGTATSQGLLPALAPGIAAFVAIAFVLPILKRFGGLRAVPSPVVYALVGVVWVVLNGVLRSTTLFGGSGTGSLSQIGAFFSSTDAIVATMLEALTVVAAVYVIEFARGPAGDIKSF